MKNIDLMIKDRRHSCNPRAAIRLGEPGGEFRDEITPRCM